MANTAHVGTFTVASQDVVVGDHVFNDRATHPAFAWYRINKITPTKVAVVLEGGVKKDVNGFEFDGGYTFTAVYGEGVAVKRDVPLVDEPKASSPAKEIKFTTRETKHGCTVNAIYTKRTQVKRFRNGLMHSTTAAKQWIGEQIAGIQEMVAIDGLPQPAIYIDGELQPKIVKGDSRT